MPVVCGIKFRGTGKVYYFSPGSVQDLAMDDYVIVGTVRGKELGRVAMPQRHVSDAEIVGELKPILRRATTADLVDWRHSRRQEMMGGGSPSFFVLSGELTFANWFESWLVFSRHASSCARSACEMRPRSWGAWVNAADPFAVPRGSLDSVLCRFAWPSSRTFLSARWRYLDSAGDCYAVWDMRTSTTRRSRIGSPRQERRSQLLTALAKWSGSVCWPRPSMSCSRTAQLWS